MTITEMKESVCVSWQIYNKSEVSSFLSEKVNLLRSEEGLDC